MPQVRLARPRHKGVASTTVALFTVAGVAVLKGCQGRSFGLFGSHVACKHGVGRGSGEDSMQFGQFR